MNTKHFSHRDNEPILIAHRGNCNGPNHEQENHPDYITQTLERNFYVEIDVWKMGDKIFLGHDAPQYEIDLDFLRHPRVYAHAKNIDALYLLVENNINCFSHNIDEAVLTLKGEIWTYPGKQLTRNSICVMPEWHTTDWKTLSQLDIVGICSDYVGQIKMASIYKSINDKNIVVPQENLSGFCRAIWANSTWTWHNDLYSDLAQLREYGIVYEDNTTSLGKLHWTLFQFQTFPVESHLFNDINDTKIIQSIITQPVVITFKGLAKSRNGLMMCGYSSDNINGIRDELRLNISNIVEPHPQDIYHSTIFRCTKPIPEGIIDGIIAKWENKEICTMTTCGWEFGYGTWTQRQGEKIVVARW